MNYLIAFLVAWLANAIALKLTAAIVPGVRVDGFKGAAIGALALGLVSSLITPLATMLSLPFFIVTLGLFYFVLMGGLFYLAAALAPGFEVDGCLSGILGAIVLGLVNWGLGVLFQHNNWW